VDRRSESSFIAAQQVYLLNLSFGSGATFSTRSGNVGSSLNNDCVGYLPERSLRANKRRPVG
jgi:hypothetical protein